MRIEMEYKNKTLSFESADMIEAEDMFKAWQLITGSKDSLVATDDEVPSAPEGHEGFIPQSALDAVTTGGKILEEARRRQLKEDSSVVDDGGEDERPQRGDKVKAQFDCPNCDAEGIFEVEYGNKFMKCPGCQLKLFLMAATTKGYGYADWHGNYYHAKREYIPRSEMGDFKDAKEKPNPKMDLKEYEQMFSKSDDPNLPDATNTIREICDWLDKHKIDHSGVTLKGKLLDLVHENTEKD